MKGSGNAMSFREATTTEEERSEIVKRLKDLRKGKNESQKELAEAIGASSSIITNVEQGKSNLPLDVAMDIARHYGVTVDYICGLSDDMTVPENVIDTLCQYISISQTAQTMSKLHKMPLIHIEKNLFDYLNALDRAEQLKRENMPDDILSAFQKTKAEEMTRAIRDRGTKKEFVDFVLLSQDDMISDRVMELIEKAYENSK